MATPLELNTAMDNLQNACNIAVKNFHQLQKERDEAIEVVKNTLDSIKGTRKRTWVEIENELTIFLKSKNLL